MKIGSAHLTYCLNIFPGENWNDNFVAIKTHISQIKKTICPNQSMGLGMRLSAESAKELLEVIDEFKDYLEKNNLYVFTMNGFPYGDFHRKPVKETVYLPDWGSEERVKYTADLAKIMSELIPVSTYGSISTVPVCYGKNLPKLAISNLFKIAECFHEIEEKTGKLIQLALEPEPDCYLETSDDVCRFFELLMKENADLAKRHLGVCVDTCHMALQFENPLESIQKIASNEILIPKIQISSVLKYQNENSADVLKKYDDGVYLHQTLVKHKDQIQRFKDLPDALKKNPQGEWRVHCHVPLYFDKNNEGIQSTSDFCTKEFIAESAKFTDHFEIETYTFSVLPDNQLDIDKSICLEYETVLKSF